MGQVNYLLRYFGLHPIYHGTLDFAAYALHTPQFRAIFMNAVAEENTKFGFPLTSPPRKGWRYVNYQETLYPLAQALTSRDLFGNPTPERKVPFLTALYVTPLPADERTTLEQLTTQNIVLRQTRGNGVRYSPHTRVLEVGEEFLSQVGVRELTAEEKAFFFLPARAAVAHRLREAN
jgi:hypothetical protein